MKIKYERPVTELLQVELETGFCAVASVEIGENVVIDNTQVDIDVQVSFDDIDLTNETTWE